MVLEELRATESVTDVSQNSPSMYNKTPAQKSWCGMISKHPSFRFVLYPALLLAFSGTLFAQRTSDKILVVNGRTAGAPVRQINGRAYIDLETLAQVTNAVFTVEAHRIVLTIPSSDSGATASNNASPQNSQKLSRDFSAAAISALSSMREWRVAVRAMILYGLAVSDTWVQSYHEQTLVGIRQAGVAAYTDADKNALQLLRSENDLLTSWATGVDTARQQLNGASTVDPNALQNDTILAKIQSCSQFLNSMILNGSYNDDPSCH